jgi:hypothetical protein
MTYTIKAHKRLSFLSSQIKITVNQWADTFGKDILYHVIKHSKYSYRMNDDMKVRMKDIEHSLLEETGNNDAYNGVLDYLSHLGDSMQSVRRARKNSEAYHPLKEAKEKSRRWIDKVTGVAFQRSRIKCKVGGDTGLVVENPESEYSKCNHVTVGVSWARSVFERGFSLINAPDALMLVMSCTSRNVAYVDEDGMNAWKVRVVKFKHGKGFEDEGWLVTHKSTEHDELHPLVDSSSRKTVIPHAYGKNLSKAHSLMKQRTVRHLTKMLDA